MTGVKRLAIDILNVCLEGNITTSGWASKAKKIESLLTEAMEDELETWGLATEEAVNEARAEAYERAAQGVEKFNQIPVELEEYLPIIAAAIRKLKEGK